jgi:hypothetical protein
MNTSNQAVEAADIAMAKACGAYLHGPLNSLGSFVFSPKELTAYTAKIRATLASPPEVAQGVVTDAEVDSALDWVMRYLPMNSIMSDIRAKQRKALERFMARRAPVPLVVEPSWEQITEACRLIFGDRHWHQSERDKVQAALSLATPPAAAGGSVGASREQDSFHVVNAGSGEVQKAEPCVVSQFSSRICSEGTKGCMASHADPAEKVVPVAEPVAWRRMEGGFWVYYETKAWPDLEPLYATQIEQDSVHSDSGDGVQGPTDAPLLSESEQRAVLSDLMGLECLLNRHDCWITEADARDMSECVPHHEKRVSELLAIGRAIIAQDPECWHDEQKDAFKLRYSERAAILSSDKAQAGKGAL